LIYLINYVIFINKFNIQDIKMSSWNELMKMTQGARIIIERVKVQGSEIALEGNFELPPLARLTMEDQIFIIAFIRCHGSIKEMETMFGISYPTVKNRLNRLARQLEFVEVNPPASKTEILEELDVGAISLEEALERLRGE
jgi:hypothetical protein